MKAKTSRAKLPIGSASKAVAPESYQITSDSIRSKLTSILVQQPVAQAMIESWLDGRGVEVPEGMTPRIECEFTISIVPIPPNQNGNVE